MTSSSHGWICYLEIPARDVATSAAFYRDAFGWRLRTHDDGATAFDDGRDGRVVSGMWVTDRPPMTEPGIVISIMVDDVEECASRIEEVGGEIVRPYDPDGPEKIAWFRDPGGNVLGIYAEALTTAPARTSDDSRAETARGRPDPAGRQSVSCSRWSSRSPRRRSSCRSGASWSRR